MKHVVFVIANNESVPYFNWFAEHASRTKEVRLTFVALCRNRPRMIDEMAAFGFECHWIRFNNQHRRTQWISAIFRLRTLFKSLNPDVVHTHLFDDAVPTVIAGRMARIPKIVVTKQDTAYHWFYARKGIKMDRLINRLATNLIAVSGECRDFILEKENADAEKVILIHHGIPIAQRLGRIDPLIVQQKKDLWQTSSRLVIGTVARYIDWKGYKYIIEAAPHIVDLHPNVLFLFVGSGEQRQELELMVQQKNLTNHVRFTEWIDQSEMPSVYETFDIFLHAASMEPFGFVIAEAMAQKLPIVSTSTGAAKDGIRNGENGILIADKSADHIVQGIQKILASDRNMMGEKAHETAVEQFDFERMYQNYIRLYNS